MSKRPIYDSKLDRAFMNSFIQDVMERTKTMRGELLNEKNTLRYNHGRVFESPANKHGAGSGEMKKHSSMFEISYQDIVAGNAQTIFLNAHELSEQMNESVTGEMIRVVSDATEKTGNVVSAKDKSIHEALYDSLKMIELPLDENGELSMPTMMVSPQTLEQIKNAPPASPEFNARLEKLKQKKKNEAIEREAQRLAKFERKDF